MKTKSEGATPIASANYMKSHFTSKIELESYCIVKQNQDFYIVAA